MTDDALLLSTAVSLFGSEEEGLRERPDALACRDAWDRITKHGLHHIAVPECLGGQGGSPSDALTVLTALGRTALPLPVADAGLLLGWLSTRAGLRTDAQMTAVAPGESSDSLRFTGGELTGHASHVGWGRVADDVACLLPLTETTWQLVIATPNRVDTYDNLAGEPRDRIFFDGVQPRAVAPLPVGVTRATLFHQGALTRVAMIAGALQSVFDITVRYTSERKQFGRAISDFQAVQQHLVTLAEHATLVSVATGAMSRALARGSADFEIAAAKLVASRAATAVSRSAHQAHGALGLTHEYQLQKFTRRLWAWRDEYGNERYWAGRVGSLVAQTGADQLYPRITAGSRLAGASS